MAPPKDPTFEIDNVKEIIMANQKLINARISQKHDYEANWMKAANFVPGVGEIIVYDPEIDTEGNIAIMPEGRTSPYDHARFKCGDGKTKVNDLPFIFDYIEEQIKALADIVDEKVSVEIIGNQLVFTK